MGASANPASMFEGEKSLSPQLLADFQGFSPELLSGLKSVMSSLQGIQGFTPQMSKFEQQFLQGLTGGFNPFQTFATGMQNIAGLGGPEFLQNISNTLRPALVTRPFEQGAAQLREQAALTARGAGCVGAFQEFPPTAPQTVRLIVHGSGSMDAVRDGVHRIVPPPR